MRNYIQTCLQKDFSSTTSFVYIISGRRREGLLPTSCWMCYFISLYSGDCVAASRDELHIRKMKLNYQEVGQCSKDAQALWERKLIAPGRTTLPQDKEEIYRALCQGERSVCVRNPEFIYNSSCSSSHMSSPIFVYRCPKEQAGRGLVASFSSAPAASQNATASGCPRHPLPWPVEAAHSTTACHPGGSRCVHAVGLSNITASL